MKKRFSTALVIVVSGLVLFGCAQANTEVPTQPDQNNNAAGIVLEGADQQKNIRQENVKSIQLYDLDGKSVEREFDEEEISDIVKAFNDSMIDDTAYIEMIAGYTMIISLNNDAEIRITSYGNEERIIATVNSITYHLISPEIGKILLGK
ncbi:MAG: hypothetical protein ACOYVK_09440 [Bacillota bacterium]